MIEIMISRVFTNKYSFEQISLYLFMNEKERFMIIYYLRKIGDIVWQHIRKQ